MKGLDKLHTIINEFIDNCKVIDDTAHVIQKHSDEFLKYLDMSIQLNSRCKKQFGAISGANCALRDQYDIIWNTSSILLKNIITQQEIFEVIKDKNFFDEKMQKKSMFRISMIRDSLEKVDSILKMIILRNNEIVLIDYLLIMHNDFENDMIEEFGDLKNDITQQSSEILEISKKLLHKNDEGAEKFNNFESIIEDKDTNSVAVLSEILTNLTDIEERMDNKIQSFFSKMTEVAANIKKIFQVSESIFDLLKKKEGLVKLNLEKVAEIAVILSLEIKNYVKIQNLVPLLNTLENKKVNDLSIIKMLEAHIIIALDNIDKLVELNHYMVEIFDSNVVNEEQAVELVEMDSQCMKHLKVETNRLYDFILSEKELVAGNLKNTKIIAKNLEKISSSIE